MLNHVIDASLTTQNLTFQPGNRATFGVIVVNRSDRFAAFELQILAATGDRESNFFKLSPEVSAAKPPGDRTEFRVEILDSPIPNFIGDINITIIVSSPEPELATERRLVLRLTVEPEEEASLLSVSLPTQRLQVYPRNTIDVPVQVHNLGLRSDEVTLHFKDLDLTWLVGTNERRLRLEAGRQKKVVFQCCPPGASQVLSKEYPFTIIARNTQGAKASAAGVLEVVPVGFVEFEAKPSQQRLPAKSSHSPDWLSNIAVFQLHFNNASNLQQQVAIEIRGKDCPSCQIEVAPESANLSLGEETSVKLSVKVNRPWIGRVKRLHIEAKSRLSDQRLNIEPETQPLTLKVIPIIPIWLLFVLLTLLSALLAIKLQPASISHVAAVNSVLFSGTSGISPLVLSGADDCTIRSWKMEPSWNFTKPETLSPNRKLTEGSLNTGCKDGKPQSLKSPKGLLAVTGQAVWALEFLPENNRLVFAGLENGEIQAWDVNSRRKLYSLKDEEDITNDRVLSLAFTQNSHYLYGGYGSGTIRRWSLSNQFSTNPQRLTFLGSAKLEVWAIALSPNDNVLISAGRYKSLIYWDLSTPESPIPSEISLSSKFGNQGDDDYFLSLALDQTSQLLAAGGSDGSIVLFNLQKCQRMKSNHPEHSKFQLPQIDCPVYDRWFAAPQKLAIRSLRFTPDGRQLVSAGDDGRIVAWKIEDKKHAPSKQQVVATLSRRITSIDLIPDNHRILVASGAEDFKVRLHLFEPR